MSHFDAKIQIRANHVVRSVLQVAIPSYELTERLHIGLALLLSWEPAKMSGHEKTIGTLHVRGHLADDTTVFIAESTLQQIAEVAGYADAELAEVREAKLPAILMPYMRAQVANLLSAAGYHHVTLPADLNADRVRASRVVAEAEQAAELAGTAEPFAASNEQQQETAS
jgi:preprotein translocase subunit SecB